MYETLSVGTYHPVFVRLTDKSRGQLRNADARSLLKPVASSEAHHHDNSESSISDKRQINQSLEHVSVSKQRLWWHTDKNTCLQWQVELQDAFIIQVNVLF